MNCWDPFTETPGCMIPGCPECHGSPEHVDGYGYGPPPVTIPAPEPPTHVSWLRTVVGLALLAFAAAFALGLLTGCEPSRWLVQCADGTQRVHAGEFMVNEFGDISFLDAYYTRESRCTVRRLR